MGDSEAPQLLYTTPEFIVASQSFIQDLQKLHSQSKLMRFVIDEAHCVSHWGQDFWKDYLQLEILKQEFPDVPILALTATATDVVRDDIAKRIWMQNVIYF